MKVPASAAQEKLGFKELLAIGVGGMIGGGIFSILGLAVGMAGTAAPWSFLVGTVLALFVGHAYARLAVRYPSDGASFVYLLRAWPQQPWLAVFGGWLIVLGYIATLALYAYTFAAYGAHLLGVPDAHWMRFLLSQGVLAVFLFVNLLGVRASGLAEDWLVYLKLFLLLGVALWGIAHPAHRWRFDLAAPTSVLLASGVLFVAFEGFQLITNAVQEAERPQRNVPRAIYAAIGLVGLTYFAVAVMAVGSLPVGAIVQAKEYALAAAVEPLLGMWGFVLVDVAALLATSSAIHATLFGCSRLMAEMAAKGDLPRALGRRNRAGIPSRALAALTGIGMAWVAVGTLDGIASFASLVFILTSIGVVASNWRLAAQTHTPRWISALGLVLLTLASTLVLKHIAAAEFPLLMGILGVMSTLAALAYRKQR